MEIFQIDENLYQSSKIDDLDKIKKFDVCIDLAGNVDLGADSFKVYLKWSIKDGALPDLNILNSIAVFGCDLSYKGKLKVLVHCDQGLNRSSLVNGLILYKNGFGDGKKIIDYIRSKRPGALTNNNFTDYLLNLK